MEKNKIIEYLLISSENDAKSAQSMFESKHYTWALFIWQLVIEKRLKAKVVQVIDESAPFTHDLVKLAKITKLPFSSQQLTNLGEIGKFNINARYEDYKQKFYKQATKSFTNKWIKIMKDLLIWLEKQN